MAQEPLLPSSDDDSDYVPSEGETNTSPKSKGKKRAASPALVELAEPPKKKKLTRLAIAEAANNKEVLADGKALSAGEVNEVWKQLQASEPSSAEERPAVAPKKKVKIRREHEFAGEKVIEEVEVDEDSQEAKDFFNPPALVPNVTPRAPPRKRRGASLTAMASSIRKGGGKKLSTLEKSALDWKRYVAEEEGLKEKLDMERKDGYLDRKEFMDRARAMEEEERYKKR